MLTLEERKWLRVEEVPPRFNGKLAHRVGRILRNYEKKYKDAGIKTTRQLLFYLAHKRLRNNLGHKLFKAEGYRKMYSQPETGEMLAEFEEDLKAAKTVAEKNNINLDKLAAKFSTKEESEFFSKQMWKLYVILLHNHPKVAERLRK